MIQGTSSHCGKGTLVAALCRILVDQGVKVTPFKSQNMSLNSFVTEKGEEIARAQAFQAFAARTPIKADMNPILLKPKGDMASQVVFHGKPFQDMQAKDYWREFALTIGFEGVKESFERLSKEYEVIIIEGAGSPAEINLYEFDIANMKVADLADAPVILIADIERGGAFANIVGTMALLKPEHRARVRGFVLNKFRGEMELLKPGFEIIQQMTGVPVIGVLPYIEGLRLPDEDSISLDHMSVDRTKPVRVAVVRLPRISNFTDFESLRAHPIMSVTFANYKEDLEGADLLILPGTKNTVDDLKWLREMGMDSSIRDLSRRGTPIIGICGGYQMLGNKILDESGLESGSPKIVKGLGLLDVDTTFESYEKVTERVSAIPIGQGVLLERCLGRELTGYEIHMGKTILGPQANPAFKVIRGGTSSLDGALDQNGLVLGTYLHGIFDEPPLRESIVAFLASKNRIAVDERKESTHQVWENGLNQIVSAVEENLEVSRILELIGCQC
jgi:adenosylcobyric acid synthase